MPWDQVRLLRCGSVKIALLVIGTVIWKVKTNT